LSYYLAVFDPSAGAWRVVSNIIITTVTLDSTGTATISIPAGVTPRVMIEWKGREATFDVSVNTATGVVTITGYTRTVSAPTATAVASVTPATGSVTSVATTSVSVVTGVSVSTYGAAYGANISYLACVTGVEADTGYSTDASGYLHHSHSVSTARGVADVSLYYTTVVTGVSSLTASVVVVSTASSVTVVTGVGVSTGSFVTTVSLSYSPLANVSVQVVLMW